jgi:hypothetical protein
MDNSQTSFQFHEFDRDVGKRYADDGAKRAIDHAEIESPSWADKAGDFLIQYIKHGKEFMVEDLRLASRGTIPEPPSLRAWGGVIKRAAKAGLIYRTGTKSVKNVNAHAAFASTWIIKIE